MKSYAARVRAYEKQGMSTSDAQGCADAEDLSASPHGALCAQRFHGAAECTCGKADSENDYAERMLRRDQRDRLEGKP